MNTQYITVTIPDVKVGDTINIRDIHHMSIRENIKQGLDVYLSKGDIDARFIEVSGCLLKSNMIAVKVYENIELVKYIGLMANEAYILKLAYLCVEARDELKHKITKENLMIDWVSLFGDKDYFLPKIKSSVYSLRWVQIIGYEESLKHNIDNFYDAYLWAKTFRQDADYMKKFVADGDDAICWANSIGDKDEMIKFLTTGYECIRWANIFPEDRALLKTKITEPRHAYDWMKTYGDVDYMMGIVVNDKKYHKLANDWVNKTKAKAKELLDLLSRVN